MLHTATRYTDEHAFQQTLLKEYPIEQIWLDDTHLDGLSSHDWIIDAITGLGLNGPLNEKLHDLISWVNHSDASVFSVDIPSGLGDRCAVSNLCISSIMQWLSARSPSPLPSSCPQPLWEPPDCPSSFPLALLDSLNVIATVDDEPPAIPALNRSAYKNTRGSIAVFRFKRNTPGRPVWLPTAFTARSGFSDPVLRSRDPRDLRIEYPQRHGSFLPGGTGGRRFDAILAGPGWGRDGRRL